MSLGPHVHEQVLTVVDGVVTRIDPDSVVAEEPEETGAEELTYTTLDQEKLDVIEQALHQLWAVGSGANVQSRIGKSWRKRDALQLQEAVVAIKQAVGLE